jgi:hypothetical protein
MLDKSDEMQNSRCQIRVHVSGRFAQILRSLIQYFENAIEMQCNSKYSIYFIYLFICCKIS